MELIHRGAKVYGTARTEEHARRLVAMGIEPVLIPSAENLIDFPFKEKLADITHLLDSIPLARDDHRYHAPQAVFLPKLLSLLPHLEWAGYLSTTAVYGDSGGEWVDENSLTLPVSLRGEARLQAEKVWQTFFPSAEIFRLPGIYGPGRNILPKLLSGEYKTVRWDTPRYSNRVHVADIVAALSSAMKKPRPGRILNVTDDFPCPHADYVEELCKAIGAPKVRYLTPEEAERELSPSALDFFRENKRISNKKLHQELLPRLRYPSFREALPELVAELRSEQK